MELEKKVGFLGYGNMGSAILDGLLGKGIVRPGAAGVFDPDAERQAAARALGAEVFKTPGELAAFCDVLLLAVKPQTMDAALRELGPVPGETLVISIAAGIPIAFVESRLGEGARIVRVMPNTPALVQAGAAGIALGANCTEDDAETARAIFSAIGIAAIVDEALLDAVTALSGSGPAYFFYLTECLIKAAAAEGLSADVATRLAAQTLFGAGKLLAESGESAATLRERVTSKGGTTEAALKQFQADGLEAVVAAAVRAAAQRSKELGG